MRWRVHRACILLELIDDDGAIRAQGIEISGAGAEADVAFDNRFSVNTQTGQVVNDAGFYAVAVRGKGRMFTIEDEEARSVPSIIKSP